MPEAEQVKKGASADTPVRYGAAGTQTPVKKHGPLTHEINVLEEDETGTVTDEDGNIVSQKYDEETIENTVAASELPEGSFQRYKKPGTIKAHYRGPYAGLESGENTHNVAVRDERKEFDPTPKEAIHERYSYASAPKQESPYAMSDNKKSDQDQKSEEEKKKEQEKKQGEQQKPQSSNR